MVVRLHPAYSLLVVRGRLLRERAGFWRSRAGQGGARALQPERFRGK